MSRAGGLRGWMMWRRNLRWGVAGLACAALVACGSANNSNSNSGPAPTLDVAASSPHLEISGDVPASAGPANAATGFVVFDNATDVFLPSGSGGNPDNLGVTSVNASTGRIDISLPYGQEPGVYELVPNGSNSSGDAGDLFLVLVYPAGQASASAMNSTTLTQATELTFNNSSGSPTTGTVTIPPRLGAGSSSVSLALVGGGSGLTVNSVALDGSNNIVVNLTISGSVPTVTDPSTSPQSGGYLVNFEIAVPDNGFGPTPYQEVLYLKPAVPV